MRYRRANVAGGTFFFTVNLANRSSSLLTSHIHLLRNSVYVVQRRHAFDIVAMVVLPDHLHAIWAMPPGDGDYPLRWSLIKANYSRSLTKTEYIRSSRALKRKRGIWQRRYWEHQIRDDSDLVRHVDYIHANPVKHGYVIDPVAWPFSSFHRYIRKGIFPADWAVSVDEAEGEFGEHI